MLAAASMAYLKRSTFLLWLIALATVVFATIGAACSLGNIRSGPCSDTACADQFGLGSDCVDDFCSQPKTCQTGFDCRAAFGGGACVEGLCRATFELPTACDAKLLEPENLLDKSLIGVRAPIIAGGMFRLSDESDPSRAAGARLVVREINASGGLGDERPLALILCDVGGPADQPLAGDERAARIRGLVDFFASLGAPFVVGPTTSSDSLIAVERVTTKAYPMVLISPSATSPALSADIDRLSPEQPGLFWRTPPSDDLQGAKLATAVVGQYPEGKCGVSMGAGGGGGAGGGMAAEPVDQVAMIHINDVYGAGLSVVFNSEFKKIGGEAFFVPFEATDDLGVIAQQAIDLNPDAFLIVAIDASHTLTLMNALASYVLAQTHRMIYLTDGSKSEDVLLGGTLSSELETVIYERTVGTAPASPAGDLYDIFAPSIQKEFQVNPAKHSFVAHAYDAAYVASYGLAYARHNRGDAFDGVTVAEGMSFLFTPGVTEIGVSKTTWTTLRAAMEKATPLVNIKGVTGPLDFNDDGEASAPLEVWQPCADCGKQAPCLQVVAEIAPD
jgi:branched-chain amino acid transport system substrate-binding protein